MSVDLGVMVAAHVESVAQGDVLGGWGRGGQGGEHCGNEDQLIAHRFTFGEGVTMDSPAKFRLNCSHF